MKLEPYPKYKSSGVDWLDEIPPHWEAKKLKFCVPGITVGIVVNPSSYYVEEGIPCLRSFNISSGTIVPESLVFISPRANNFHSKSMLHEGDIVLVRTGRTGIAAIVTNDFEGANCIDLLIVRRSDRINTRLLYYILNSETSNSQIEAFSCGAIQAHFNTSTLAELIVPLPPLSEQLAMVHVLDCEVTKIDELISDQQDIIALLEETRQAVISHTVTKGLTPNVGMKPSGFAWLGELPEHWEVCRVKTVSTFITSGPRGWSERVGDDGHLFVQSGDLNDSLQVEFETVKRVLVEDDAEAKRTRLVSGDVVVCITGAKTGNVAVCASVPEVAYVNQHLCLIRPSKFVLPKFLGLLLKSKVGQTYFEFSQYGLKQGLGLEDIREAPVFLPPLTEQASIVVYLELETSKIDALVYEAISSIELLQERRSALIAAVVTGKVDVRGVA